MGIKRGNMKSPFFKSLLLAGALLLAWNCTDDTTIPTNLGPLSDKTESVWVINIGENNNLYIAEDGTVYDTQWNVFGTFSEGNIVTSENEVFMVGVDTTNRPMAKVIEAADGTKMVEFDDGTVTDTEGKEIGVHHRVGSVRSRIENCHTKDDTKRHQKEREAFDHADKQIFSLYDILF